MIIENPQNKPPKVVFRPIWVCPLCGRIMIFEKGVSRWYYLERRIICFKCDKSSYTDTPYKEEKDDTDNEINVGDEVISIFGDRGYVTQNDGDELCVLYPSGAVGHSSISTYKKTGKHFSQITKVLKQMKG